MSHGLVTDLPISRDELLALRDAPVHVIGAASAEGVAVVRLLQDLRFTHVTVHDMRERATLRKAFRTTHGAYSRTEQDELWEQLRPVLDEGRYAEEYLDGIADAALVVLGQGWYLDEHNRARIVDAVPAAARVSSMTDLYFALHRGPFAAITGTNGKSTTSALAEHLLDAAGIAHRTAGNERSSRQFLPDVAHIAPGTWALLEISNRQLLQTSRSPQVAAITALTPDHLEEHEGLDGYEQTKARLFAHQGGNDVAIVNADDARALAVVEPASPVSVDRLVRCGTGDHRSPSVLWRDGVLIAEDMPVYDGSRRSGPVIIASDADLKLPGDHNRRNAAVAVAVALACGADPSLLAAGLRSFEGKALRLQHLEDVDGVSVWSDLKATTPEATLAAIEALGRDRRIVLVCGGDDKGLDYSRLAVALVARGVQVLAVPGSATDQLEREFEIAVRENAANDASFERVDGLETALDRAFELAASGDCVIVSPAAAGFWTSQLQGAKSLRSLIRRRATVPGGAAR